ncbi:MAG TPA: crotonase/enoyl-CoA hydratase family protein [Dongiaceae bacterium]
MTVVTKTALPLDNATLAQPMRARRPVDFALLDSASSAFSAAATALHTSSDPAELNLNELDGVLDHASKIFWQYMRPEGKPSFTLGLLRDMKASIDHVTRLFADSSAVEPPVRYTVMASRMPGIFNLGGDLRHFAELIRNKDRATIRQYAHACIDVQHPRAVNMNLPIISISLVQGDALGGGFEAALADNVIIAEKSAKFGLPECLFNLFPGMGALSFLTRKIGAPLAEKMVFSGQIYTASELHEMGVVEVVCEDGMGEQAVYDFVEKADRSFASRRSVYASRQIINPVSRDELIRITDMWVESALTLTSMDLRKMERLASAQDRRWATVNRTAAE